MLRVELYVHWRRLLDQRLGSAGFRVYLNDTFEIRIGDFEG